MSAINPGIRRFVAYLSGHWHTTDSGDGETHDHACDRDYGYVVIVLTDELYLSSEAERVADHLRSLGLTVAAPSMEPPPEGTCWVQGSYCPVDGIAVIDISHIHDRMLS